MHQMGILRKFHGIRLTGEEFYINRKILILGVNKTIEATMCLFF